MIEIWNLLWIIPLCFIQGIFFEKRSRKQDYIPRNPEEPAFLEKEPEERNPMSLRNGYGVTRSKDPTFAEQWVNIMNFSGESQTEGDYEEREEDYPEEDMG